jgi:hypothetical protein
MAGPEYDHPQPESPGPEDLEAMLSDIQHRLESNDENENTMERYFNRDRLLEKQWELEEELREYRIRHTLDPDRNSTTNPDDPS